MAVFAKVILCEIKAQDRRRSENGKHPSLATILLLFDFNISLPLSLFFRARSNSLSASPFWYLVVHS